MNSHRPRGVGAAVVAVAMACMAPSGWASGGAVQQLQQSLEALEHLDRQASPAQLDQVREMVFSSVQSLGSDMSSVHEGIPVYLLAARASLRASSIFLHRYGRSGDAYDFAADASDIYDSLGTVEGDLAAQEIQARLDEQLDSILEGSRLYHKDFQAGGKSAGASDGTLGKKGGPGKKKP